MSGDFTRKRLNAIAPVGTTLAMSPVANMLFGGVFVVMGGAGVLASVGVFGQKFEAGRMGPHWIFAAFGFFFFALGVAVWVGAARAVRARRRRDRLMRQGSSCDALIDYPWSEGGFVANPWQVVVRSLCWAAVLAAFLTPFNYLVLGDAWRSMRNVSTGDGLGAFFGAMSVVPALIVGIFDFVLVYMVGALLLSVVRAMRFGRGRMAWDRFPIRPGGEVELRFELPRAIAWFDEAEIELRCVEEFWVDSGRSEKSRTLVHEQVWGDRVSISRGEYDSVSRAIPVRFNIPADARSTSISTPPVVFWRADLRVKMPGPDYRASFFVPVYAASRQDFPVANGSIRD